jgi:GAF domain-containing protein
MLDQIRDIVTGPGGREEKLQAVCGRLADGVAYFDWVGFYLVDETGEALVLGPFVGEPTEHVRIPFGRGICGQAAQTGRTLLVQDVRQESNYLSCSLKVQSEIVLPVLDPAGWLVGELDIDSHALSPFTDDDVAMLEEVCRRVGAIF